LGPTLTWFTLTTRKFPLATVKFRQITLCYQYTVALGKASGYDMRRWSRIGTKHVAKAYINKFNGGINGQSLFRREVEEQCGARDGGIMRMNALSLERGVIGFIAKVGAGIARNTEIHRKTVSIPNRNIHPATAVTLAINGASVYLATLVVRNAHVQPVMRKPLHSGFNA
jgi:hypothetical protein